MTPRLRDIARMVGVSEATVSRVLNERPGVAEETRIAVRRVLGEIGYRRAGMRHGTVGLIIPELDNPIFPAFAQAISSNLTRAGFTTILCTLGAEGSQEDDYISMLVEQRAAGVIFVCGMHANGDADHTRYHALRARRMPQVFVNGFVDGLHAPFVSVDDRRAADLAVNHLVSMGHRRIGCAVGPRRFVAAQRKIEGYERAMDAALGSVDQSLILEGVFWLEGGRFALERLIELDITALICGSDMMALGAINAARQHGFEIPGDISIVGFDDIGLAAFTDPPLTTIRQPVAQMGAATVRALLEQITTGDCHPGEFLFEPELVVRGSTGRMQRETLKTVG